MGRRRDSLCQRECMLPLAFFSFLIVFFLCTVTRKWARDRAMREEYACMEFFLSFFPGLQKGAHPGSCRCGCVVRAIVAAFSRRGAPPETETSRTFCPWRARAARCKGSCWPRVPCRSCRPVRRALMKLPRCSRVMLRGRGSSPGKCLLRASVRPFR